MADIHGLAAQVTLVLVLIVAGWAVGLGLLRRPLPPPLVGGLAWAMILLVGTGLVGVTLALTDKPPADPLHIVYGLLGIAVLPGALAIARMRTDPRRTVVVLSIASLVLLILVARSFQTGG